MSENFKIRLNEIKDEQTGNIIEANFRYDDVSTDHDRYMILLLRNVIIEKGIKIEVDEFHRLEKDILGSCDSVFSAKYQKDFNSIPYQLLGSTKSSGISYDDILKKLNG